LDGIFRDFVGERGFLDRVVVGVWGVPRQVMGEQIDVIRSVGIAGPKSPYARLIEAKCRTSGNPVQWKYGKYLRTNWSHQLSPFQFSMRSHQTPVTCAGLLTAINNVMRERSRHIVSLAELTFDTHFEFDVARRDLISSARAFKEFRDPNGRRTLYVGSPRSSCQLRIYQKTKQTLRFEFVLRPRLLRALHVVRAHDLLALRTADIWRFAHWDEVTAPFSALAKIAGKHPSWRLQACGEILGKSVHDFERILRTDYNLPTAGILHRSSIESALRRMQANLIW
jgi:hypothetical protein